MTGQPRSGSTMKPITEIIEMVPVRETRIESCAYCGTERRIIHLLKNTTSGVDAPVCFPCFRNGFGWLIGHFPGEFFADKHSLINNTAKPSE